MRENAFCMVFYVRWISHHSSQNPTLVGDSWVRKIHLTWKTTQNAYHPAWICIFYIGRIKSCSTRVLICLIFWECVQATTVTGVILKVLTAKCYLYFCINSLTSTVELTKIPHRFEYQLIMYAMILTEYI